MSDATARSRPAVGTERSESESSQSGLTDLLSYIRDARSFDFSGYKRPTLIRRIRKRMHDVGVAEFLDYRDLLESNGAEFSSLFDTILINVTSFFRDPQAWNHLQREVVPTIVAHAAPDRGIRVWSAGCSSGEEAYSLAMVFVETLGANDCAQRVKIYGTDVDENALRDARTGVYPSKALQSVPEELRDKYFEAGPSQVAFRSGFRRLVIFGRHDLTRDAPISRLDLLACRNTLMYFNAETQWHVIDRLHYALREGGFLFLGRSEMPAAARERFDVISLRQRIFSRRPDEPDTRAEQIAGTWQRPLALGDGSEGARRHLMWDLVLDELPTAAIVVGADGKVVLINGRARTEFGLARSDVGRPFQDLDVSYHPVELRSLIEQAYVERRTVEVTGVKYRRGPDDVRYVDVVIHPLWNSERMTMGVGISFIDMTNQNRLSQEVTRTRQDLETSYEELQSTNEELETTNEELQSSIEELETTNEELQSTNEELETTNQELQSGNENLARVNEDARLRGAELDEARTFLEGVISSIGAGIVVLDAQLRVRTWNRGAETLWGLRADEVRNQPFFGIEFGLPTESLHEIINNCIAAGLNAGPVAIKAMNRIGRAISCSIVCAPLTGSEGGVVLLMEEARPDPS